MPIGGEEVGLEGSAAVSGKTDLGGDPAANQHDMGQQTAKRQLGAELLLEVPEVAACGQRFVHVLTEHILCHNGGFNISVRLHNTQKFVTHYVSSMHDLTRCCMWQRLLYSVQNIEDNQ